jgi:hypothetical protein
VKQRNTRWITGTAAVALWGLTVTAAGLEIGVRWYLAIWLATFVGSLGVLICIADSMIRARQAERTDLGRDGVGEVKEAIARHAARMEQATKTHGDKMERKVFAADRWYANGSRGETLAKLDAAEAVRRSSEDSGPINIVRGRG